MFSECPRSGSHRRGVGHRVANHRRLWLQEGESTNHHAYPDIGQMKLPWAVSLFGVLWHRLSDDRGAKAFIRRRSLLERSIGSYERESGTKGEFLAFRSNQDADALVERIDGVHIESSGWCALINEGVRNAAGARKPSRVLTDHGIRAAPPVGVTACGRADFVRRDIKNMHGE